LLPAAADPFFRADRIPPEGELPAEFAILIVESGEGRLSTSAGEMGVRQGDTLLIPYAAGPWRVAGRAAIIRCRPPSVTNR
jgi:mannose-6-phosphate isomerase